MKFKIILLSLLAALGPQLSHAISMGSISDAISPNTTSTTTHSVKIARSQEDTTTNAEQKKAKQSVNASQSDNHMPNPALFIEDAAMTGYIHSQLLLKKNIPNVSVTTENAVVSLSGTVDTQEQADTLVKTALAVKGVKAVNTDGLVVRKKS